MGSKRKSLDRLMRVPMGRTVVPMNCGRIGEPERGSLLKRDPQSPVAGGLRADYRGLLGE